MSLESNDRGEGFIGSPQFEMGAAPRISNVVKLALVTLAVASLATACGSESASQVGDPASSTPSSAIDVGSTPQPATTPNANDASSEVAEVLAAVAANRVFEDNSFGGQDVFERINIVDTLGKDSGDAFLSPGAGSPIDNEVRGAIEVALDPLEVTWVSSLAEVIDDVGNPGYEQVGAILTLGVPDIAGTEATVVSNLWCGELCAIGGASVLGRATSGSWSVTGVTGSQWIS